MKKIFAAVLLVLMLAGTCQASQYGRNLYRSFSQRLGRTRTDYPGLSDEQFANFREVRTTGIAPGKLYRSSSPVSTWGERNIIADNASRTAGVRTFINLADKPENVNKHKGFSGSYYSTQKIIALGLGMKYHTKSFRSGLARGIKLMAESDPPYLVHCTLGRDRTGFVCALIECLMGADIQEVERDYMISFYNYFGITPNTKEYDYIVNNEIRGFLARAFGVKDIDSVNLYAASRRYFASIGVSVNDIETLREKLSN